MKTRLSAAVILVAGLAAAALATHAQPGRQQPAAKSASAPGGGSMTGVVHAPKDGYSAQLLLEQAERRALRDLYDFVNMDPDMQAMMWDALVGPDQLNDGHGVAMVRPLPGTEGGIDPRGGGFGDPRGIPLVELSWAYTQPAQGTDSFLFDMDLSVTGDVTLTGTNRNPNTGLTQIKATEIQGTASAADNWTENWSRAFHYAANPASDGYLEGKACATDLLGNTFACGGKGDGKYTICEFSSVDGSTVKLGNYTASGTGTDATIYGIVIDPEQVLYVEGTYFEGAAQRTFVARHDPDANLTRTWIATRDSTAGTALKILSDRRGGIYLMTTSANGRATIAKYGPIDGTPDWTWQSGTGCTAQAMALDFAGNPHITYRNGTAWNTTKVDELTGTTVWTSAVTNGVPVDITVNQQTGDVYVLGSRGANTTRLVKYDPAGAAAAGFVVPQYGTTGAAVRVALDWVGNPYVAGYYGSGTQLIDLRKFNPATGVQVWADFSISPVGAAGESNHALEVADLLVDAGGSVYVGGYRAAYNGNTYLGKEFFCVRWEQPYVSIPQIARYNPDVRIENHSVWLPQIEDPGAGFNYTFPVFNIDVDSLISDTAVTDLLTREVNYVLGTVKGQVALNLSSNVNLGVNFETTATGGSYDATAAGELAIAVPGEEELNAGQPFDITVNFQPDPNGMEMIANSTPSLSAGFVSNVTGTMDLDVYAWNKNFVPDYPPPFISQDIPLPSLSSLDNITLLPIFGAHPPRPGQWVDFEVAGVSGRLTMPDLRAEGTYSTTQAAGTSSNNDNDDDTIRMSSSLSQQFVTAGISITDLICEAATGFPLSFGWSLPGGDEDNNINASIGLIQAHFDGELKMEQDLTMDMKPYVRLTFPGANPPIADITRNLVKRVGTSGDYSFEPETAITVTLPADTGALEIKPFFGVNGRMTNSSGIRFGASAGFDPFALSTEFTVVGVNIFSLDECYGCTTIPIVNSRFNIFDNSPTSPWFNFTGAGAGEVELPSIVVKGDVNNQPQLMGASLAATRLIIYDQRSPSQSQLNTAAGGTQPVVLYGRKFFAGTTNRVRISHHGRTEVLVPTRLNDQTLLVNIPRRFFLLPGVAKIWTTNTNGRSETINFPIEYPVPNLTGIDGLDGANDPPIWAGDPRWMDQAVRAIDGKTPAGNDSFIARRDYYTLLRTTLWNTGLFDANDPNRNLTAQAYFPAFKGWELNGNPKSPPGFPTMIVDGVPLSRHRPFVNDGYFRSDLQPGLIALPHNATLQINNPGPGGGGSRVLGLEIPAPAPVVSSLEPAAIAPGSVAVGGSLRLVVHGPSTVPWFSGYEAAKAGNFTPQSVILFDGVAVPTTFSNTGELIGQVPQASLTGVGAHVVSVSTPSGGTTYVEQQRTGGGTLLPPVTMDSGGMSLPVTFEVYWPAPEIAALSTTTMHAGAPPEGGTPADGSPADGHNFGITGTNFAPGCGVFWNGRLVPSTRSSDGALRVTVSAADVAAVGTARVQVVNPAPNRRSSTPAIVQIVP